MIFRYLACSYHLQALCMLGKPQAAADFLKSQMVEAICSGAEEDALARCHVPSGLLLNSSKTALGGVVVKLPEPRRPAVALAAMQVNKAVVLLQRGLLSSALTMVESALRSCPDFSPAVQCLVYVYLRQGRTKQALNVLGAYKQNVVA